jgi:hypothetical protein
MSLGRDRVGKATSDFCKENGHVEQDHTGAHIRVRRYRRRAGVCKIQS